MKNIKINIIYLIPLLILIMGVNVFVDPASVYQNEKSIVDAILKGDIEKQEVIDRYIFAIYGLTEQQISYIRRTVDGKIDSRIGETN